MSFAEPSLESDVRRLCDLAFRSGEPMLSSFGDNPLDAINDPKKRLEFFRAVHRGFAAAQVEVRGRLLELEGRSPTSPDAAFALISDLTTFAQVGDLLVVDPPGNLFIVEVKEGDKNKKILDFANFMSEAKCDRAFYFFAKEEGKKGVEQLGRLLRQAGRMGHVLDVLSKGAGVDPDTKERIIAPDVPVEIAEYDLRLSSLLEEAKRKSWAIDLIDDCLFVGAYDGAPYDSSSCTSNLQSLSYG